MIGKTIYCSYCSRAIVSIGVSLCIKGPYSKLAKIVVRLQNTGIKKGHVWDKIHKLIDEEVGCKECNVHGHDEINGIRKHIRIGIGKTIQPREIRKMG